jgi:hypothetical protein
MLKSCSSIHEIRSTSTVPAQCITFEALAANVERKMCAACDYHRHAYGLKEKLKNQKLDEAAS